MRRPAIQEPAIQIREEPGKPVEIRVRHYGRVPDLTSRFSPEVRLQAVNKLRTRREQAILSAARGLSPMAYKVVEEFLFAERCALLQHKLDVKKRVGALEDRVAREQQGWVLAPGLEDGPNEPSNLVEEHTKGSAREADDRTEPSEPARDKKPPRREHIAHRLAREAAERAKAEQPEPMPKMSRKERKESDRILAKQDEDRLSDAREFKPRKEHIAERLAREHADKLKELRKQPRSRERSR